MIGLGWLASEGHGVPRDPVVAAEWFAKAATASDPEGQYIHAYTQEDFPDARVTLSDLVRQFKKSARQGHVASQLELAIVLATGDRSIEKDSAAAADLLMTFNHSHSFATFRQIHGCTFAAWTCAYNNCIKIICFALSCFDHGFFLR